MVATRILFIAATCMVATAALAQSGPAASPLPAGPGRDLVAKDCASCHELSVVTSAPRSAKAWADTVEQMIAQGAPVTDAEKPVINAYLAKNFPAKSTAAEH